MVPRQSLPGGHQPPVGLAATAGKVGAEALEMGVLSVTLRAHRGHLGGMGRLEQDRRTVCRSCLGRPRRDPLKRRESVSNDANAKNG
jgi:hypothetical protein